MKLQEAEQKSKAIIVLCKGTSVDQPLREAQRKLRAEKEAPPRNARACTRINTIFEHVLELTHKIRDSDIDDLLNHIEVNK